MQKRVAQVPCGAPLRVALSASAPPPLPQSHFSEFFDQVFPYSSRNRRSDLARSQVEAR